MILKATTTMPRKGDCFTASVISFNAILMVISVLMLISYSIMIIKGKQYIDLLGPSAAWIVAFLVIFLSALMMVTGILGVAGVYTASIPALKINVGVFTFLTITIFIGGIIAWHEMWNIIDLVSYNLRRNMALYNPSSTADATTVWDDIQRNMHCCGINRSSDWGKYCPSYKYTLVHKYPESCEERYVYGDGCMAKLAEMIRLDLWTIGAFIFAFTVYGAVAISMTSILMKRLKVVKREYYTHEGSPSKVKKFPSQEHPKEREAREGSTSEEPESSATLPADVAERGSHGSRVSLEGEDPGPWRKVKRIGAAVAKGMEGGSLKKPPMQGLAVNGVNVENSNVFIHQEHTQTEIKVTEGAKVPGQYGWGCMGSSFYIKHNIRSH